MSSDSARTVLITGSSRGIGLATAKEFLKHGDQVVVFCRHKDHMDEALEQLKEYGDEKNILSTVGDVKEIEDVQRIVKETIDRFGKIDILMNNAGIAVWKPIEETTDEEWDDVLATNAKGAFLFTREVVHHMIDQKDGVILNISSNLGVTGRANYSAYAASKFAMVGLTQVLADELAEQNVKVYTILPGSVATKLHLDIHPWEDPDTMITAESVAERIYKAAQGKEKSGSAIEIR